MITKSKARAPGRLTRHLARTDTNESVSVGHSRDVTPVLALAMDELAMLGATVRGKKNLFHIIGNPEQTELMTEPYWETYWAFVEREFGLASQPFIEVRHSKKNRDHRHRVYSLVRDDGRLVSASKNYQRNELVSRLTEVAIDHPLRPGRHHKWVKAVATARYGNDALQSSKASQVSARLAQDEQQQADRKGLGDVAAFKSRIFSMYVEAKGDWRQFAGALDTAKMTVARGRSALLVIDEMSLFQLPLARLLREEAKRCGKPIKIASKNLEAVFGRARPLDEEIQVVQARQQSGSTGSVSTTHIESLGSPSAADDLSKRMTASLADQLAEERRRHARLAANFTKKRGRRRPRLDERIHEYAGTACLTTAAYLIRCLQDGRLSLRTCIAIITAIASLNNVVPLLLAAAAVAAIRRRKVRIARDALRIDFDAAKAARASFDFASIPIEVRPRYVDILRSSLFTEGGPHPGGIIADLGQDNAAHFIAWWVHASDKQRQVIKQWGISAGQNRNLQPQAGTDAKKQRRRGLSKKGIGKRDVDGVGR